MKTISSGTILAFNGRGSRDILEEVENLLTLSEMDISYGSTEQPIDFFNCMDSFWRGQSINELKRIVFGFQCVPIWYKDVIEEFNNAFKNIKINVELELPIKTGINHSGYTTIEVVTGKEYDAYSVLFSIDLSDAYEESGERVYYLVHHLLQMMDISRGFIAERNRKGKGSIQKLVRANNKLDVLLYGSDKTISEFPIDTSYLYLLDDPELVLRTEREILRPSDKRFRNKQTTSILSYVIMNRYGTYEQYLRDISARVVMYFPSQSLHYFEYTGGILNNVCLFTDDNIEIDRKLKGYTDPSIEFFNLYGIRSYFLDHLLKLCTGVTYSPFKTIEIPIELGFLYEYFSDGSLKENLLSSIESIKKINLLEMKKFL